MTLNIYLFGNVIFNIDNNQAEWLQRSVVELEEMTTTNAIGVQNYNVTMAMTI